MACTALALWQPPPVPGGEEMADDGMSDAPAHAPLGVRLSVAPLAASVGLAQRALVAETCKALIVYNGQPNAELLARSRRSLAPAAESVPRPVLPPRPASPEPAAEETPRVARHARRDAPACSEDDPLTPEAMQSGGVAPMWDATAHGAIAEPPEEQMALD